MKRTLLHTPPEGLPQNILDFIGSSSIYDSSCSREARVYFIDRDGGFYLKKSPKSTLSLEAKMTEYFHSKGLGTEVISYISDDCDYMLTRRIAGEDCTHKCYLDDPCRLCDTLATRLRMLHETDFTDCPVTDRMGAYLALAEKNFQNGLFDLSYFQEAQSAQEAYAVLQNGKSALKNEVLIHGDYCLPNVMLDAWSFSGFIDVGNGGVGDRHVDLFWGAWTLNFNLGTDKYRERFLDAYGRDKVDTDKLRIIAAAEVFG